MSKIKWESAGEGPRPGSRIWLSSNREWRIFRTDAPSRNPQFEIYQFGVFLTSYPTLDMAKRDIEMLRGEAVVA